MKVALDELERLARQAILNHGHGEAEAQIILDVLMYGQLRRNGQGVVKLIGPGMAADPSAEPVGIERETGLSALVNGGNNHAMVVVNNAVDIAVEKAVTGGIGLVGIHHISTSSGSIGYYARRIAEAGLVGVVFAGAAPVVAPEGSCERILGTNPIAVALPTGGGPVVLDMATSAMTFFGVLEAVTVGRELPDGVAYDEDGQETTDAARALKGALRTFDRGAKGSGLSFVVQALTGPLVGASFVGLGDVRRNWGGHLILAIDPDLLAGLDALGEGVTAMVARVKGAAPLPGGGEIFVPGERGDRYTAAARERREVDIEATVYTELRRVGAAAPPTGRT